MLRCEIWLFVGSERDDAVGSMLFLRPSRVLRRQL